MSGLREKLGEAFGSLREVFRNPGLRRILLAFAGSIAGDWAFGIAVAVYAYEHGGATAVGVISVLKYGAVAVATPFGSTLGDHYPRRLVMISSDTVRAVLVFSGAALVATDGPELGVYALYVATTICSSPFRPTQASLLPELAESPGELAAANVASSTVESIGVFAGPALAGLMLAVTSITTVYLFNGITFIWSALLVLGVRPRAREQAEGAADGESGGGFLSRTSAGFHEIFRSRDLRLAVGLVFLQTVVFGASVVFTVSLALDLLDIGKSGVGFLNAAMGIGALVGGFVALVLVQRGRLALDFGIGVLLWSAPLLVLAVWPTVATAVAVMAILGLANSLVDVNVYTILQRLVPAAVMARVFGALWTIALVGMAIGGLLMPGFISTVGLRWGLVVIGAVVSTLVVLGIPGLRRIDHIALAPPGLELLRGVSLLGFLPEPTLEALARALVRVDVEPGEAFIREGEHGDRVYVIESGAVEVTKEGRHIAHLGPGDYVGEIALLHDVPRTATVTATSASVLQALDRDHFIPAVTGQGAFREAADVAIATRLAML